MAGSQPSPMAAPLLAARRAEPWQLREKTALKPCTAYKPLLPVAPFCGSPNSAPLWVAATEGCWPVFALACSGQRQPLAALAKYLPRASLASVVRKSPPQGRSLIGSPSGSRLARLWVGPRRQRRQFGDQVLVRGAQLQARRIVLRTSLGKHLRRQRQARQLCAPTGRASKPKALPKIQYAAYWEPSIARLGFQG